jgi:DNA-binding YbaB/EbfC family protein
MKNIGNMMRQAQEMQQKLADMQTQLGQTELTGNAGGGMITITMNARGEAKAIKISPQAVDVNDLTMLEDLVVAAINDARKKIEAHVEGETQKIMGGMALPPGMKLPF